MYSLNNPWHHTVVRNKIGSIWAKFLNLFNQLHNVAMHSWWHRYIKKTVYESKFQFKQPVGNPTPGVKSNQYNGKMLNFKFQTSSRFFFSYTYSENKTGSEKNIAGSFKGRMSKLVIRLCWKIHVFKSWQNMTYSSWFEIPWSAVFRTCLLFTVAITTKYDSSLHIFGMKTVHFGGLVLSETTVTRS